MTQEKMQNPESNESVNLGEIAVVLVAQSNNPSIINPDFLRHNEIVNADLALQGDPITSPLFSQVTFERGIVVNALPDRVSFQQTGDSLASGDILCPEIAKRYVEKVPHVPYSAIGVNPKGYRYLFDEVKEKVSNILIKSAELSFRDVTPEVHLKTIYQYDTRKIVLDIAEATMKKNNESEIPIILFQANIHRDLPSTMEQQNRIKTISDILTSWEDDLSDFNALIKKFNFQESKS
ncbi:MAG: hypothetical protein F4W91_03290 [Gemmatimonadetes bacterium]|nr:hypothetical protein [Gemmatimonadota bacterium]